MSDASSVAVIDRNLALEAVRVTEAAALAASREVGRGDERSADEAAMKAMRAALNVLQIDGTIVIGEGEADETDMLYIGEKVGSDRSGPPIDIALDPLEGATICAKGGQNALAVVALAAKGSFLSPPAVYMEKIAVGPNLPPGVVDLDESPVVNLRNLAKARGLDVSDLLICILDRPRHEDLIAKIREAGARVMLITDGDVSGVIATAQPLSNVDMYMGIGGAHEGVLAAAALACVGGQMQGRLVLRSEDERARARRRGITDPSKKYALEDMAKGDIMFAATGITDGTLLRGINRFRGGATTHSIVIRAKSGTLRSIEARHRLDHFGEVFGE
ncbi:class II fructose-bisphosphatase [Telmatospirillum siberiense]|uniref:class II fructose-bisphosphatase n=1 Tax=Telmatospirillum siberiense TaxID=382514 RepID=UPI0018EB31EC|nr:class II fructose-bisphosphatase [Telmatospirillum siberiense]